MSQHGLKMHQTEVGLGLNWHTDQSLPFGGAVALRTPFFLSFWWLLLAKEHHNYVRMSKVVADNCYYAVDWQSKCFLLNSVFLLLLLFISPVLSNHIKVKKYEAQSHEL